MIFIENSLPPKSIINIYIKIILSGHIINNIDLELNNSEKSIFRIESGGVIISILKTKHYWDIKGNNIKIYVLSLTWRVTSNISERNI